MEIIPKYMVQTDFKKVLFNSIKIMICITKHSQVEKTANWKQLPIKRQGHPTPVLLPGKPHERRSLVGCGPWGRKESDMTERLHFSLFTFMHWRRKWQPTPVFLPGESQGRGRTESDTSEVTQREQPYRVEKEQRRVNNAGWEERNKKMQTEKMQSSSS